MYNESLQEVYNDLTSQYYTVIPHDFGRARPPPITNTAQLQAEIDLVETLGNMQITNNILKETEYPKDLNGNLIHPLDAQLRSLNLDVVEPRMLASFGR